MKIDMKITGAPLRFDAFIRRCQGFDRAFMSALNAASMIAGKEITSAIQDEMLNEPMPNSAAWAQTKAAKGLHTQPLFRTSLLFNYIKYQRLSFSWDRISGEVGWPDSLRYPTNVTKRRGGVPKREQNRRKFGGIHEEKDNEDMPIWLAAYVNERGLGMYRPSRPFVTRAYEKVEGKVHRLFVSALSKSLPSPHLEEAPF